MWVVFFSLRWESMCVQKKSFKFLKIGKIKAGARLCWISWWYLLIISIAAGLLFRFFPGRLFWNWMLWRETKNMLVYLSSSPLNGAVVPQTGFQHTGWLPLPMDLTAYSLGKMKSLAPAWNEVWELFLITWWLRCLLPFTTNSQLLLHSKLPPCIHYLWHCQGCIYKAVLTLKSTKQYPVDSYTSGIFGSEIFCRWICVAKISYPSCHSVSKCKFWLSGKGFCFADTYTELRGSWRPRSVGWWLSPFFCGRFFSLV